MRRGTVSRDETLQRPGARCVPGAIHSVPRPWRCGPWRGSTLTLADSGDWAPTALIPPVDNSLRLIDVRLHDALLRQQITLVDSVLGGAGLAEHRGRVERQIKTADMRVKVFKKGGICLLHLLKYHECCQPTTLHRTF